MEALRNDVTLQEYRNPRLRASAERSASPTVPIAMRWEIGLIFIPLMLYVCLNAINTSAVKYNRAIERTTMSLRQECDALEQELGYLLSPQRARSIARQLSMHSANLKDSDFIHLPSEITQPEAEYAFRTPGAEYRKHQMHAARVDWHSNISVSTDSTSVSE